MCIHMSTHTYTHNYTHVYTHGPYLVEHLCRGAAPGVHALPKLELLVVGVTEVVAVVEVRLAYSM